MKPNRRENIQTKHKRNLELVADYKNGMLIKHMMAKYKITRARIYQIISKY